MRSERFQQVEGLSHLNHDGLPVKPEDLALKESRVSPGAPAVVLHREVHTDDVNSVEKRYYRIKILTGEGRKHADVEIPFVKGVTREFPYLSLETDQFNIALPAGYEVDEAPAPLDLDYPFGSYKSSVNVVDGVLKYQRSFEIRQVLVPLDGLDDLRQFMGRIAADERIAVVLKQSDP